MHRGALAWRRSDHELSFQLAHPLFHTEDSHTACSFRLEPFSIVDDCHGHSIWPALDDYRCVPGVSMGGGVLQGFLHQPINPDFHFIRQIAGQFFPLLTGDAKDPG